VSDARDDPRERLSLSLTLIHSLALSLSLSLTLSHSPSLIHSLTLTHSHSHSTHSHAQSHSLTLTVCPMHGMIHVSGGKGCHTTCNIIIIINFLFITLTSNLEWCDQALKSTDATEEWHYQKPATTINFGNSLGPGTTWFQGPGPT